MTLTLMESIKEKLNSLQRYFGMRFGCMGDSFAVEFIRVQIDEKSEWEIAAKGADASAGGSLETATRKAKVKVSATSANYHAHQQRQL